ncbi:MAG: efflux RND transporter permease subunit [Myxococcota bacterium]
MNALLALLERRRLIGAIVALLVGVGLVAWATMVRQEDPTFEGRFASVVVPWPGADPLRVERLLVQPLEDALADVPEIRRIEATARTGVAVLTLELRDHIYETDDAWDEVRTQLAAADLALPEGSGPVDLDTGVGDPASVVLLLTGHDDLLVLRRAARELEDALLLVPGVSRVERIADPGEQVTVRLEPAMASRLDLDPGRLASVLQARNAVTPSGNVVVDGRSAVLAPKVELPDLEDFRKTPWVLPDGSAVPLGELARVTLEPSSPASERVLFDGRPAVGLAVIPELPQDLVSFGDRVDTVLAAATPSLEGVSVERFAYQPEHVRDRLGDLTQTLLFSMAIVAGVLLLAMGFRLGLVVASVVPLVALGTVAIYAMGGGVLHQISIAALVLALGLLVDNAIVVAETVQRHLDDGVPALEAARRAVLELGVPLGTATGTTVAAFVPMWLAGGGTADFTRAIPVVVVTALVLSYFFALAVTPALAALFQRPTAAASQSRLDGLALRLGRAVVARPGWAVTAVGGLLVLALAMLPAVRQQFFPLSDRARVLVTIELPEGAHLSETRRIVERLDRKVANLPDVERRTAFIGRGPPRFYYNLNNTPQSPHAATLVIDAASSEAVPELVARVRQLARDLPEATVVPRRLQQGPPVGSPVEVRLEGADLDELGAAAEAVTRALRDLPETRDVHHDLGIGVPTLSWAIDDAAAGRRGLARRDVALSLLGRTRGLPAGEARGGREPVPVVVTTPQGERTPVDALGTTMLAAPRALSTPLSAVAHQEVTWGPAAIRRVDRTRVITVGAELVEGASFSAVTAHLDAFQALVPSSVEVRLGGEAEGSSEANAALLQTFPLGVGLLLLFLFLEFDSVRRVGIVLVTVPLAAVGVIPGLALSGQPFGFMSLLGVIALVGVVVNNAIVLLDVIEHQRRGDTPVSEAVAQAVRLRTRPILLTTGTTVVGMLPLALSSSPLWPPLAWAMISGLVASTGLTLVAVPALYQLLVGRDSGRWLAGLGPAVAGLLLATPALGAELTFAETVAAGREAPTAQVARHDVEAAEATQRTARRSAFAPVVTGSVSSYRRDAPLEVEFELPPLPGLDDLGPQRLVQQPESLTSAGADVRVPIVDAGAIARIAPAKRARVAAEHAADRAEELSAQAAADAWLDVRRLDAERQANRAYVEALASLHADLTRRYEARLVVEADVLRAEVALLDAQQDGRRLDVARRTATLRLGAVLGRTDAVEPQGPLPVITAARKDGVRSDLVAQDAAIRSLRAQRSAVWAEGLPSVEGYGAYRFVGQDNLVDNDWLEVGVVASWTPMARGTRPSRARTLGAQLARAEAERRQLALAIEVERAAAEAESELASSEVEVRTRAVEQAELAATQVRDRFDRGLATLTDLLQAEADLRNQRTRREVAQIEAVRAAVRRAVARGGWATD